MCDHSGEARKRDGYEKGCIRPIQQESWSRLSHELECLRVLRVVLDAEEQCAATPKEEGCSSVDWKTEAVLELLGPQHEGQTSCAAAMPGR